MNYITHHPLNRDHKAKAVFRFLKWQLTSRLNPTPIIYSFTDHAKLIIQKGISAATGNLYCGLYEYNEMGFLLHLLRPEDVFVDVGANIGSFTVLASAQIGAHSISIEPLPATYTSLLKNIAINQIQDKVIALNLALGSKKGTLDFTSHLDSMNHVANAGEPNTVKVQVECLDSIIESNRIPILLKIDVEGFETEVINGAEALLKKNALKAIIIELPGIGSRYGFDESLLHEKLMAVGFQPFQYDPLKRELKSIQKFGTQNTIYIRDLNFVRERISTAPKIKILHHVL
ncbi:MAG: FkbM family methyltransferase [Saprospiraceae bacterium]